jgi:hypothetical protein
MKPTFWKIFRLDSYMSHSSTTKMKVKYLLTFITLHSSVSQKVGLSKFITFSCLQHTDNAIALLSEVYEVYEVYGA